MYDATLCQIRFFWISGMLNVMFVSDPHGLVSLPFHCSGHVLFSTCMLQSADLMPLVGATCFPNLCQ